MIITRIATREAGDWAHLDAVKTEIGTLASIDIALCDLKARALGVSVADLLTEWTGGRVRANAVGNGGTSAEHIHARRVGSATDRVLACRDAVGPD